MQEMTKIWQSKVFQIHPQPRPLKNDSGIIFSTIHGCVSQSHVPQLQWPASLPFVSEGNSELIASSTGTIGGADRETLGYNLNLKYLRSVSSIPFLCTRSLQAISYISLPLSSALCVFHHSQN